MILENSPSSSPRGLWFATLLAALWIVGCASGTPDNTGGSGGGTSSSSSSSSSSSGGGTGGTGGTGGALPCGRDCSTIQTPQCLMAVCNEGQYLGTVGACVVIEAPAGTSCDDGQYCTVNDACDGKGMCQGGGTNNCGMTAPDCEQIACDEIAHTCSPEPAPDGAACTPTDLCQGNGTCTGGTCVGEPKDCSFSPYTECNTVACNPANGKCEPTPDSSKNGATCTLTGDLCNIGRTCSDGQCAGGTPKDCSALTVGCTNGICEATTGACVGQPVAAGGACFSGIDQCHTGTCDANATCVPMPVADGTPCDDHNACTTSDSCTAGVCGGTTTTGCALYFTTGFEPCPAGWTFGGDFQCGAPTSGPMMAHGGANVIATKLSGSYSNNDSYDTTIATSPPIDLTTAKTPELLFWTWINTEGSTYDGFNLKISIDNGATFDVVPTVTPAYGLTVNSQSAWGGDQSALGWQSYSADLTAYVGHQVILRFSFRSDGSGTYPGVFIDDILVAEPNAVPLAITTTSLPDAVAGASYAAAVARTGGSSSAAWTIVGGTNNGWLSIDPATGALAGTPTTANLGPVTVNVQVAEPLVPGNVATKTFTFNVINAIYFETFEGACPNSWTLAGDWQCGVPTTVGPATAYSGTQCLATQIAGNYHNSQAYATTIATSPDIDLTTVTSATALFRMWLNTEAGYDGANLKVSTDGGATYTIVTGVTPAYTDTVNTQQCWDDDESNLGWQLVSANLTPYVGHVVKLRFAFRSDGSGTYPGVYIDDVLVAGN